MTNALEEKKLREDLLEELQLKYSALQQALANAAEKLSVTAVESTQSMEEASELKTEFDALAKENTKLHEQLLASERLLSEVNQKRVLAEHAAAGQLGELTRVQNQLQELQQLLHQKDELLDSIEHSKTFKLKRAVTTALKRSPDDK